MLYEKNKKNFWGLSVKLVDLASEQFLNFVSTYCPLIRPKTCDTSKYGVAIIKSQLLMETKRTYANMERTLSGNPDATGQNFQQYMSDSPWDQTAVFKKVRTDISQIDALQGGTLSFDESGDRCAGPHKAGAARQYIGRDGKVDMGQVVVLASYSKDNLWAMTDAELFLPRKWFSPEKKKKWKSLHIPPSTTFKSKITLAKEQYERAVAEKLPFDTVGMDSLYGSDTDFRMKIKANGKNYMASVKKDTQLWLANPSIDANTQRYTAEDLAKTASFTTHTCRHAERGPLSHDYAFFKVWTKQEVEKSKAHPLGYQFNEETLVIRKETDKKTSYALSNIALDQTQQLVQAKAERYFVERTIQDAKSELGFDELEARKYRALMHTLALCAISLLYMVTLKMEWRQKYAPIVEFRKQFPDLERLPDISLANVKELFRAAFPLPQPTKQQAVELVTRKLFNRASATQSRAKKKKRMKKKLT